MGLTILSCIIFGIGIALMIASDKYRDTTEIKYFGVGVICMVIGVIFTCTFLVMSISNYINYDLNYQCALYEKQVLECRLENKDTNTVGNELLYNDIVEFNNELRRTKKYANSPWTNWLYNADIATIDYIEIDGLNN